MNMVDYFYELRSLSMEELELQDVKLFAQVLHSASVIEEEAIRDLSELLGQLQAINREIGDRVGRSPKVSSDEAVVKIKELTR